MTDSITLIAKACGHYGIIRDKYTEPHVCCSQCEALKRNSLVPVLRRAHLASEKPPRGDFAELDRWIRRRLEQEVPDVEEI